MTATSSLIRVLAATHQTSIQRALISDTGGAISTGASIIKAPKADGTPATTILEIEGDITWAQLKAVGTLLEDNNEPSAPKNDGTIEDVPAEVPGFNGDASYLVVIDKAAKKTLLKDSEFTNSITNSIRNTEFTSYKLYDTYWNLLFKERSVPFTVSTGDDDDPKRNCAIIIGGDEFSPAIARIEIGVGNSFISLNRIFPRGGDSLSDALGLIPIKLGWRAYFAYAVIRPKYVYVLVYKRDGKLTA